MGVVSSKFKRAALALVPALALVATYSVPVQAILPPLPNAYDAVTEMATPVNTQPFDIITGPDGNIWYTIPGNDQVVKASAADGTVLGTALVGNGSGSCAPTGITIGPDKNIWVACFAASLGTTGDGLVVRIIPSTLALHGYRLPGTVASRFVGCTCAEFLTPGPDGYLWLTESGPGYVTKLNVTTGAIHRYPLPAGINADPRGIAVGRDGNLWIAESVANRIGRMSTSGVLAQFAVPTASAQPFGITAGPDGRLFYTEIRGNAIGRITTSGVSTEIHLAGGSFPRLINVGPDGNLWFSEYGTSQIGSMTPGGTTHEVATTTPTSKPFGIATGPDGNVWFAESNASFIGKLGARHVALSLDKTAIGFGNVNENDTAPAQRLTLTNNGAESLAAFSPTFLTGGADTGVFAMNTETCSAGPIAAGGTCYADITPAPILTPGPRTARASFKAESGTPTQQILNAGLTQMIRNPTCQSVGISTSSDSPQHVGVSLSLIGAGYACPDANPLYQFFLRNPAGVWSVLQSFGPDNTALWNTTGYKPGTYLTGVWVKDANSHNTYDAYAFGTFTIDFPSCTSTNMTRDASSPQVVGATVNFTASALGCPNPLFQWWVRNAAGVWSIAVPFAAGTTFAWNTTGLNPGTYQIGIWAKQAGSTRSYEAFAFLTYTLTSAPIGPAANQPCSAVNVDAAPASPQDKGTAVTLTTTVFGCDAPLYKFWIRDTSAVWAVVQDYSPTSSYAWSTASRPAGTYLVGVWIKQTGDSAQYEAYSFITYTLTIPPAGQPCSSVGLTSSVTSPVGPGNPVTFTGAALGCGTPTYKFFVAPPGGAFTQVQAYSSAATYNWATTGLPPGPYQIGVWARNAGSTRSYEAFAFITFQILAYVPCAWLSVAPSANGWGTNNIQSQSPQPVGITVDWLVASGCDNNAEYSFYVQRPGSTSFAVLRSYGPATTFSWKTAGLPRGNYRVKVLVRNQGSASSVPYDTFAISEYELV